MQSGKDTVLLVQPAKAALKSDGFMIGNLTDNTHSMENELSDEKTKFGRILAYGDNSESFELTCFGDKKDPGQRAVINAIRNKEQLKVWEVDLNTVENEEGEEVHDTIFAYVLVESVEKSNPQEGFQEISSTVQVIGQSQEGQLPKLPIEVIDFAKYGFEKPGEKSGEFGSEQTTAPVEP
ncbi:phage major tail protein, TP901-1 family [Viridibacillus arvi]|uniref:phage major tail protein, TP901-1 family n=1 Tax=Viridibacillus arvi TaxID=263475 RepID=UPI00187BB999|nr:phage major tail protein, TP901-1 family [Viridibacillus sp. JNUCC-6]QOV10937.1 phage major tail protein, TP901-1 family [Viridibacillus sp. JNUCC-6]